MSDMRPYTYLYGLCINEGAVARAITAHLRRVGLDLSDRHFWAIEDGIQERNITHTTDPKATSAVVIARLGRAGLAVTSFERGAIEAAVHDHVFMAVCEEQRSRAANPAAYLPRPMSAFEVASLSTDGRMDRSAA